MRGVAFDFSRSATDFSAVTCCSSSVAALVVAGAELAGAACAAAAGGVVPGRSDACCEPITQPAMRPKKMPAMPNAIESDFTNSQHIKRRRAPA